MIKILSFLLLSTLLIGIESQSNGTESYFLSPHGLGKTPEVDWALETINNKMKINDITYKVASASYKLTNITVKCLYNDARQETIIPKNDEAEVTGGKIQFTYNFNYSKQDGGKTTNGYGYGSVLSDNLTYHKQLSFCQGFICWRVPPKQDKHDLSITNLMSIRRMQPYDQNDYKNIVEMLFNATENIKPYNLRTQILTAFNEMFPTALNQSLNHQVFGQNINYTYHSQTHGEMKMNIVHYSYDFGIRADSGYRVVFVTQIDGYDEPVCNTTVPLVPDSFEIHGGSQNFQLNCLYESVVKYLHSNKWLDTVLNYNWQTDNFQFYAGDLFDNIKNLYLTFSPISILEGSCIALKEGLKFFANRQFDVNTYTLSINYDCTLKGANLEKSTVPIARFNAPVKLYIKAQAGLTALYFTVIQVELGDLSFTPVDSYFVTNPELAKFKARSVLQTMKKTKVFGSGFPTLVRDLPKTVVTNQYVLYYDSSHKVSAAEL